MGKAHEEWQTCGEVQLQLGLLHRLLSDYPAAESWLQQSIQAFQSTRDQQGEARALNEWAWLAQLHGALADATTHAEAALSLLNCDDSERGMSYRVLGMVAIQQENWQQAMNSS